MVSDYKYTISFYLYSFQLLPKLNFDSTTEPAVYTFLWLMDFSLTEVLYKKNT